MISNLFRFCMYKKYKFSLNIYFKTILQKCYKSFRIYGTALDIKILGTFFRGDICNICMNTNFNIITLNIWIIFLITIIFRRGKKNICPVDII